MPVTGVFRVWLEHPPSGTASQTEAQRVPWYANSNPDHQVELHPLLEILEREGYCTRALASGEAAFEFEW